MTDTLHRHDEGGPVAEIACEGEEAVASWTLPAGQLLDDHPELNTGGYVYFTLHETPTIPVEGGELLDFSGTRLDNDTHISASVPVKPGVEYRAHLLVAYEDGEAWHNDTVFTCEMEAEISEEAVMIEAPVLPFTGPVDWLLPVALVLIGVGAGLVQWAKGGSWST